MDQEQNQRQSAPQLCMNGCGFYGSPSFEGLCSKCHKDAGKKDTSMSPREDGAGSASSLSQVLTGSPAAAAAIQLAVNAANSAPAAPASADPSSTSAGDDSQAAAAPAEKLVPVTVTVSSSAEEVPEKSAASVASAAAAELPLPADISPASPADGAQKKKKNRCEVCRKKVGLTGFTCRCDGLFCSLHRYSDKHNCSFDYREMGQQEIRKNNPVIVSEKVNKI